MQAKGFAAGRFGSGSVADERLSWLPDTEEVAFKVAFKLYSVVPISSREKFAQLHALSTTTNTHLVS